MLDPLKFSFRWIITGALGLCVFAAIGVALVTAFLFAMGLYTLSTL